MMKLVSLRLTYPAPFPKGEFDTWLYFRLITHDGWERSYDVIGPFPTLLPVISALSEKNTEQAQRYTEQLLGDGKITSVKQ